MVKSIWKHKQSVLLIFRYINFKREVCTVWFLLLSKVLPLWRYNKTNVMTNPSGDGDTI